MFLLTAHIPAVENSPAEINENLVSITLFYFIISIEMFTKVG